MFDKLKKRLCLDCYVIADPRDNSMTFSKGLYRKIEPLIKTSAKVFTYRIVGDGKNEFGFIINPDINEFALDAPLSEIQYNEKHKCIGFETLIPTVNRIFYDYGIPNFTEPNILAVKRERLKGRSHFRICRPKG